MSSVEKPNLLLLNHIEYLTALRKKLDKTACLKFKFMAKNNRRASSMEKDHFV